MSFKSLAQKAVNRFCSQQLFVTALNDYHKDVLKAKMVPFAGYEMPVQYQSGGMAEHLHCRGNASVFDVSHMGQIKIYGNDRHDFIERIAVGHVRSKEDHNGFLSLMLNENAGIIDDTIITPMPSYINMVVNACNKIRDLEHMNQIKSEMADKDIRIEYQPDLSLIALQGPKAKDVIGALIDNDLSKFPFMYTAQTKVAKLGIDITVCRCGYTGEDGFEISVKSTDVTKLFDLLLQNPDCKAAGLAARDSLRLEAGLCLHGNDMTEDINPAEATLMWLVRKPKDTKIQFFGRKALTAARKAGIQRKRQGFKVIGKGVIRDGCEVQNKEGKKVGTVCSGTFSPSCKFGLGMIYVETEVANVGENLVAISKGKKYPIEVARAPFVETHYAK